MRPGCLFIGLTIPPSLSLGHWAGGEILSLNSTDFAQQGLIKTSQPFNYLFLSRNGRRMYAINTFQANITIIDALTLSEVRTINGVGVSPSLIAEAP